MVPYLVWRIGTVCGVSDDADEREVLVLSSILVIYSTFDAPLRAKNNISSCSIHNNRIPGTFIVEEHVSIYLD